MSGNLHSKLRRNPADSFGLFVIEPEPALPSPFVHAA